MCGSSLRRYVRLEYNIDSPVLLKIPTKKIVEIFAISVRGGEYFLICLLNAATESGSSLALNLFKESVIRKMI